MNKKAVIAMSGGVDSSVAAFLINNQGYDCMGATMKLFHNEDICIPRENSCCSLEDVEDARSVAYSLGIPYYVFNFTDRFREDVMDRFVHAYETGATPNPCIDCNRYLKFEKLFLRAQALQYDYVVTGHYARIEFDENARRYLLKKAIDETKDQSYVLYAMTQEQLAHTLFPLGNLRKTEVRNIAEKHGFVNAKKHDSQDICFVQRGTYADFIREYSGKEYPPGDFILKDGTVLGKHKGIINYTVGQRIGLGIAYCEPLYVLNINPTDNTVVLGTDRDLYSKTLTANNINLISVSKIEKPTRVNAKVRYRQKEQPATVRQTGDDSIIVEFDEPQRAITKGQAVVLYDGDTVLGGGTIQ
ncbi:MAG: tRNA 2-thiouridine(34) synthase MnmA [Clostridia bacterium]